MSPRRFSSEPVTLSFPPFTRAISWLVGINVAVYLLLAVLRNGDVVFADGTGVRLAARLKGVRLKDNLVGTDLLPLMKAGVYAPLRLVDIVEQIAGIKVKRSYNLNAPKGVNGRNSDNTLIQKVFGWEPDTKLATNYHLPTDLPEHLDYGTVARAVTIAEALARELAAA